MSDASERYRAGRNGRALDVRDEYIQELESRLDATASALTAERAQKKDIGERLLAAESRLDAILKLPQSGTDNNPDPWDAGYDVCLQTVQRLARGIAVENLPAWCPKCKAVMAHVPHQCEVVERPAPICDSAYLVHGVNRVACSLPVGHEGRHDGRDEYDRRWNWSE